jgi:predicted amidohydrolase YtcJ
VAPDLIVHRAQVDGQLVDLRCENGRIAEIGPKLAHRKGGEEIDAAGCATLPGLVDHHVHLRALAAAASSVIVGPPEVANPRQLAVALGAASARLAPGQWIRGIGYHESVAGPLDARSLDALLLDARTRVARTRVARTPDTRVHGAWEHDARVHGAWEHDARMHGAWEHDARPVRVQHRSGALWILNSAALALLDVASCSASGVERDSTGIPTGRLWRMDGWLKKQIGNHPGDLGAVSRTAAAAGITGFTDATPQRTQTDLDDLVAASDQGVIAQRLCLMTPPGMDLPAEHCERPPGDGGSLVELGPVKVLLDDTTLPTLDELVAEVSAARTAARVGSAGRAVAVHCVTHLQLVITLAALQLAGWHPGDRIEHGALVAEEQMAVLRALGLVVVTQPGLVATRGDQYLAEVDPRDLGDLWRLGSLRRAGVAVAIGTDAPFGPADPWVALRAARDRRTPAGVVLSPTERVSGADALRLMTPSSSRPGVARRLKVGQPADLCVLRGTLEEVLSRPGDAPVAHTLVAGAPIFSL